MNGMGIPMSELRTELPEELVGWVGDAARRFEVTRAEIVRRALEHYLRHMNDVGAEFNQRREISGREVDWREAKSTLRRSNCPFDNCPYADDCPAEVCRL